VHDDEANNQPPTEPPDPTRPTVLSSALVKELRASGRTWVAIAHVLRQRLPVNGLVALRLAHDWTQAQAAAEWTQRWPDDPKTAQNLTYWESWPTRDGYAPSLPRLECLAELYECAVSDLLTGVGDFRHLDAAGLNAGVRQL